MFAIQSYQISEEVNLTRPLQDQYRDCSPDYLQSEQVRHAVALFSAREGGRASDAAFHEHEFDLIAGEIRRQRAVLKRHAGDHRAVNWPDNEKRYQGLLKIAKDLKREFRLSQFISTCVLTTALRPVGPDRWTGNCPIPTHDDTSPSFVVFEENPDDQHFHCYGCRAHGDIFELVGLVFGYENFTDRVQVVAEAFGNEVQV
jgi:hypothetical protein